MKRYNSVPVHISGEGETHLMEENIEGEYVRYEDVMGLLERGSIPSKLFDKKDIRSMGVGIGISDEGVFPIVNICKDCIHILKPSGAMYEPHPDSLCMESRARYLDYVTGEAKSHKCSVINIGGLCEWFVAKETP